VNVPQRHQRQAAIPQNEEIPQRSHSDCAAILQRFCSEPKRLLLAIPQRFRSYRQQLHNDAALQRHYTTIAQRLQTDCAAIKPITRKRMQTDCASIPQRSPQHQPTIAQP
jgi:hypothetical protein